MSIFLYYQWQIYIVKFCQIWPPPWGSKFFQFHAVFGKIGKIVCWHPPGELAPPPRGNPGSATDYYRLQTKFGARQYFHMHVSVILSTGGSLYDVTSCLTPWSLWEGGMCAWSHIPSWEVSVWGGLWVVSVRGSLTRGVPVQGVFVCRRASGMHPTGILSFLNLKIS